MRAALFVDGFNLYHAIDDFRNNRLKWLSLWDLGVRIINRQSETLVKATYFSAYANHLQASHPDVVQRHKDYVAALEATGVEVVLGTFKRKPASCRSCGARWARHEEKETDVNIAVQVVAAAHRDLFDVAYVLSADTDLAPALREVRSIVDGDGARTKRIVAVFPPIAPGKRRYVSSLQQSSDASINLNESHLLACRLPDQLTGRDGSSILCPAAYK